MAVRIETATFVYDWAVCNLAKKSRYTKDFASHRFFRENIEAAYVNNEVGVALERGQLLGFCYCKHLKIKSRPMSVVHFMGVAEAAKNKGVGRKLLEWALKTSPHGYVELSCEHSNTEGMAFYEKCGFEKLREGVYGDKNPRPYTRFGKRR